MSDKTFAKVWYIGLGLSFIILVLVIASCQKKNDVKKVIPKPVIKQLDKTPIPLPKIDKNKKVPCPCSKVKVVAFTAKWCVTCQNDKKILQGKNVDIQYMDYDTNTELAKQNNIRLLPTYLIFKCGKEVKKTNDAQEVLSL